MQILIENCNQFRKLCSEIYSMSATENFHCIRIISAVLFRIFVIVGFRCQCTAAYNVVLFGRRVGAYCADWIRDGGKYCYLAGGMLAHSCPGARRSRRGRFFHTEDDSVCNGRFITILLHRRACHIDQYISPLLTSRADFPSNSFPVYVCLSDARAGQQYRAEEVDFP